MKNDYKQALKSDVINYVMKKYQAFEIEEATINHLYNLLPDLKADGKTNLYFEYLFMLEEELEDYIMSLIQNGDVIKQIEMAEMKRYVVIRYLNLKGLNNFKTYSECLKVVENISDKIMETLKDDYNCHDSLNSQYIKQLKKKFNK